MRCCHWYCYYLDRGRGPHIGRSLYTCYREGGCRQAIGVQTIASRGNLLGSESGWELDLVVDACNHHDGDIEAEEL